ncbi:hypothetical protein [Allokutzneria sp. NRRL B-24872]|uniref:hypothetical protein n=1 Tax=Allokutzneria sp. NRRL B-24872 TaxID=1137961 RepID=UPI000A3C3D17|nr:hypothetical protein [Allokutzneria sp. NRRL B-24872]
MNPATLAAVVRRFPLLGRPRPACPALPERVQEVADIADAATRDGVDRLAEGAHALNKAALIASDCGLPDLARDLCWQHINLYRAANQPLTVHQARYMLEPVLNLARLQLRAHEGDQALRLLTAMFQAVTSNTDLVIDGHTLPLGNLAGTRAEHHKLREWVWLHLIGDGIRALALAGRWDDAVAHARAHRGIGLHLMEGRQATIVAHCMNGNPTAAREALAESTPEQPWERQVAACLKVMCTDTDSTSAHRNISAMIARFVEYQPMPGYAVFRAQLGLTITILGGAIDADAASRVLAQVTDEVIASGDGYAAREVLRYRGAQIAITSEHRARLTGLVNAACLGAATLPDPLSQSLLNSTQTAAMAVSTGLAQRLRGPGSRP